jgi:hypothetical protein
MKAIYISIAIFAFINVSTGPAHGQVQIANKTIVEKSTVGKGGVDFRPSRADVPVFSSTGAGQAGKNGTEREAAHAGAAPDQGEGEPASPEQADPTTRQAAERAVPATYYDELIRLNPKAVSLYIQKAREQMGKGAGPQVIISTLEEALNQEGLQGTDRELARAYSYLGDAYLRMENIYLAVVNYNRAHALAPGSGLLVDHFFDADSKIGR